MAIIAGKKIKKNILISYDYKNVRWVQIFNTVIIKKYTQVNLPQKGCR